MKKLLWPMVILFLTIAYAGEVPKKVQEALVAKFPQATKVTWQKENVREYEATFYLRAEKFTANFTKTGEWLETESPASFDTLPEAVQKSFRHAFANAVIKAATVVEKSNGATIYEIEIFQGKKTKEIFYDSNGKEMK